MMSRIGVLVAIVATTATAGFGAGYYTRSHLTARAATEDAAATLRQSGTNIVRSAEQSRRIEVSVQASDHRIDHLRTTAQARLQKEETHHEQSIDAKVPCVCHDRALDFGTVRLLNRAREESTVESATSGTHEIGTASQAD